MSAPSRESRSIATTNYPQVITPNRPNPDAPRTIIYEVQVRAANAGHPGVGSAEQQAALKKKISPAIKFRPGDCNGQMLSPANDPVLADLTSISLGTIDDMLAETTDYHTGITLNYIKDKVGANTVWLMPVFPANDRWALPDRYDILGSPYAVRDFLHVQGELDKDAIQAVSKNGAKFDFLPENGKSPHWGNQALDRFVAKAHSLGLKVMLDIPFNHFGHNYMFYDYGAYRSIEQRLAGGESLDDLWDFEKTYEASLVHPEIIDGPEKLTDLASRDKDVDSLLKEVRAKCPELAGQELVRAFHMYKAMLDFERQTFQNKCKDPMYLEYIVPGFYLGSTAQGIHPSTGVGDNFTNNWKDVKFLYHHETGAHYQEFVRNREYLFRVMNFWNSRGVDGFRLDHATDYDSGMGANEWKYLIGKLNYYDWVRKGKPQNHVPPLYLAEEFERQKDMSFLVDVMTDGYVGDMRRGTEKNTSFVEKVIESGHRFDGTPTHVMRGLETHDEHRLVDHTGFDRWTGAGFWGIGATAPGSPMILMGQEFGEPWGLGFRRPDFLRSRFYGTDQHAADGQSLVDFYGRMNRARQDFRNTSLVSDHYYYLRTRDPQPGGSHIDQRIFAQAKWDPSDGNVIFVFNNLWSQDVRNSYSIPADLAGQLGIHEDQSYRLVNILDGDRQLGPCRSGGDLKQNLFVELSSWERAQWLRLELCR